MNGLGAGFHSPSASIPVHNSPHVVNRQLFIAWRRQAAAAAAEPPIAQLEMMLRPCSASYSVFGGELVFCRRQ